MSIGSQFIAYFISFPFQFVAFRQFGEAEPASAHQRQARLAQHVLYELPAQLIGWMQSRGIAPQPRRQVDATQMPVQPSPHPPQSEFLMEKKG